MEMFAVNTLLFALNTSKESLALAIASGLHRLLSEKRLKPP